MNIEEFLIKAGSDDVERDYALLKKMESSVVKDKLTRYIKNLIKQNCIVQIQLGGQSYSNYSNNVPFIMIDPLMVFSPNISFEMLYLRVQGIAAHEAAHILYSDFVEFQKIGKEASNNQAMVPKIAAKVDKESDDFNQELYEAIFKYIYSKKMAEMVNSLEDGAIENIISRDYPHTYGAIVAERDFIHEFEERYLKEAQLKGSLEEINVIIAEIRNLCTIAYRKETSINHLKAYIKNPDDIELIRWYALYARLGAKDTLERIAMSNACMEYLKPLFEKKAEAYYQEYMAALKSNEEDIMSKMMNDMAMPGNSELSINSCIDSPMPSNYKPPQSEYSLDMPEDVNRKIQQKIDEMKKESSQNNNSQSTSGNQQNGSQSSNNDSEANNQQNGASLDKTIAETNNGESNGAEMGSSQQDAQGNASGAEIKEGPKKTESISKCSKDNTDVTTAAAEAEAAVHESIKKLENERKNIEKAEFDKSVLGSNGTGKAPHLSQQLGNPDALGDVHKHVRTKYYPPNKINQMSSSGRAAKMDEKELKKISNVFSKKVKELLMYQSKNRIKTGLRNGKIRQSSLYRAKTDARVFSKKINGIENKARFCVLIDESGSMCGKKMVDAIKGAYVLIDACQRINVPISVLGHNTRDYACSLYHYVDYEHYKSDEYKNKIYCADEGYSNHDGLALFHSLCDLVRHRQQNEKLIMLVISDGAPAGIGGYYGELANKDIQMTYKKFEKEFGVKTIGIGIGDDVDSVPEIYENFVLVPDVEKLSDELLKILKEILLK